MTTTSNLRVDSHPRIGNQTPGPMWARLTVPVTLGLFAVAILLHLLLVGWPMSADEIDDFMLVGPLSVAHGPWWHRWRLISLLLGLVFLGVVLAYRLASRRDSRLGAWARIFAVGSALLVGAAALTVEVPDVFRIGFSFSSFELPLRVLLLALGASALGLALGPVSPRWARLARVGLVTSLVGVIGVLAIPQPSRSHTPKHMITLCASLSKSCIGQYPSCREPFWVEAHALASPAALVPQAVALHLRATERLRGRVAHLDRITAEVDSPRWAESDKRVGYPDPRLRVEATNGALHLQNALLRWLCLGLVILLGLGLSVRSALSVRSWRERESIVGRALLISLAALALAAAFPFLPESTWVSPWQYLPTFLLGPLALLVLFGQAWEAARVTVSTSATGVVDKCHGIVETPAGPWKVTTGQSI